MIEYPIYAIDLGAGQLGMSAVPGRTGFYESDVSAILKWAPGAVLTMTQQAELAYADATGFGDDLAAAGVLWRHLPIGDMGSPSPETEALWGEASARAHDVLAAGARVLVHCYGGCGRAGMAALRLMVEAGEDVDTALVRLRQVRPCAVETDAQKAWAARGVKDGFGQTDG